MADDKFGDLFDDVFGKKKKPEKGIPWSAKIINGEVYVSMEQVAELLETNDVLPAVRRGLLARIRQYRDEHRMNNTEIK